jgi:ActR/RegA family two-component response regulator
MNRILLVEDEEPFASNLSADLKEQGFIVDKTDEGEAAIRLLKKSNIKGIVLDLKLKADSKVHGLSIIEWIKSNELDIPVIVMTGHPHLAVRAFELGVDSLMLKPIESKYIAQYLFRAMEVRKLKKENILLQKKYNNLSKPIFSTISITIFIILGFIAWNIFLPNNYIGQIILFIISIILLLGGNRIAKVAVKLLGQEISIEANEDKKNDINS